MLFQYLTENKIQDLELRKAGEHLCLTFHSPELLKILITKENKH